MNRILIYVLNIVYKITVLQKTVLDSIPNTGQTSLTLLIYDIMHYAEEHYISDMVLLIDFEKASDPVS